MLWDLPVHDWLQAAVGICTALTGAAAMGIAITLLLFGRWSDRVETVQGEPMVLEYGGFFHVTGYRYINLFVHGEPVFEWQD